MLQVFIISSAQKVVKRHHSFSPDGDGFFSLTTVTISKCYGLEMTCQSERFLEELSTLRTMCDLSSDPFNWPVLFHILPLDVFMQIVNMFRNLSPPAE